MFRSELKEARQAVADLRGDIGLVAKQLKAIGVDAIKRKRALSDAERHEFSTLSERDTRLRDALAEAEARRDAAEAQNDADKRGQTGEDADALATMRAARRAGLSVDGGYDGAGLVRPRGRRFADLFGSAAHGLDGWTSGAEFLRVVGRGLHDSRLRADSMTGAVDSSGGFAVPVQLLGQWLDASLENEIVRPRCTTWPMTASELDVPAFDDLDRSAGAVGGLTLQFLGEGGAADVQVAKLRALRLKTRKGAIFVQPSSELVADAPNFEGNLSAALTRALGFGLDQRFLFGDGAAGPLGALTAPCTVVVPRSLAGNILYYDVLGMFSRLTPGSVERSVWVAHPSTIPQLGTLSVAVGVGGSAIPVMTSADGAFTILTRPVIFSEKAKALGTQSDLSLADFTNYAIGLRSDAALERSAHVGFLNDVQTYRLLIRVDGQPTLSTPVTPLNGATLSPFVTLGDAA